MSSYEFWRHFRVSKDVYEHLLADLHDDLNKEYCGGYEPVSPETRLLVLLW